MGIFSTLPLRRSAYAYGVSDAGFTRENYGRRRLLAAPVSVKAARNLDRMNGLIAATAGALKDATETPDAIQSPIFAHKNFERLEAQGAPHVVAAVETLRALLRK
jgi:hypothetical protein